VIARIEELMKYETAGDPMTGLKWTRKTTEKIAEELESIGITVSPNTAGKLLKKLGFSLRVNHKKIAHGGKSRSRKDQQQRDRQFRYIGELRENHAQRGHPSISVDTKKKEPIGNFKNPGVEYRREPRLVNDHDFASYSTGKGVPYGIYDTQRNKGMVFVGTTFDTADFAVECIEKWWRKEGQKHYQQSKRVLILADGGGSNGSRCRRWKLGIQEKLCDRHGLDVTVAHYPPGTSKWNPIEHRLFGEISKNWSGTPLDSYETMLKFIRTTKTKTGLKVKAYLVRKSYEKGNKVPDEQMAQIKLERHATFPEWNYTIKPRKM
jgi:hypothetical protein